MNQNLIQQSLIGDEEEADIDIEHIAAVECEGYSKSEIYLVFF